MANQRLVGALFGVLDRDVLDRDHVRGLVRTRHGDVVGGVRDRGLRLALEVLELAELALEHVHDLVTVDHVLVLDLLDLGLVHGVELGELRLNLDLDPDEQLEEKVRQVLEHVLDVLGQLGRDVVLRHVRLPSLGDIVSRSVFDNYIINLNIIPFYIYLIM